VIGEIQSKTWKRLSEQEIEDAVNALKPFRGQKVAITVPNQDPDRIAVAEQLALIFQKAQWDWQGINTPMTWGDPKATQPHGIQLHVSDVTDSAKTIGAVLIRVYGIENLLRGYLDNTFSKGLIEVNIFSKQVGSSQGNAP
jgi:hypothetical protein